MASSSKTNGVDTAWARAPPPNRSFCEKFGNAIYNPEDNSILGRTPKRWGIALTFYAIFYAVLAALFAICMMGLYYTLDAHKPTYILAKSLIGENPGVAYRPIPPDGVLLNIDVANNESFSSHLDDLQEFFFYAYEGNRWYSAQKGCGADDNFGYPETPCVFIKVNRIFGWQPEFYEATSLPADMPEDLVDHIKNLQPSEQNQVWISCQDEHSNGTTTFEYPWGRGLPSSFYPYVNNDGYTSPLVAVKVTPTVNTLTVIRCRAWSKNIIYNKSLKEPSGYTRIQIYVSDQNTNGTEVA